jgi:membrane-associated protease RseP (regulator of RpoE activity)
MEQRPQPRQPMTAAPQPARDPIPARRAGAPAGATAKKRTGITALAVAILFVGVVGIAAVTTGLIQVPGFNADTATSITSSKPGSATQISDDDSKTTGLSYLNLTPQLVKSRGLDTKQAGGYLVQAIMPRGPAEDAGVRLNDIIVAIDGVAIDDNFSFWQTKIRLTPIGEKMRLTIERDGAIQEVPLQIGRCSIPSAQRPPNSMCPTESIVK